MKKKTPLTAIQFNALAIITLVAFMPFAIAFITSAGSDSDGRYESSINGSTSTFGKGYWYDNGANYTSYYESQYPNMPPGWYNCAYISKGYCGDDFSYPALEENVPSIIPIRYVFKRSYIDNPLKPGNLI